MSTTVEQYFEARVVRGAPDECWEWSLVKTSAGYGFSRRHGYAHRIAFELSTGQTIPDGMVVCHRCDNPGCVNPTHLFLGTHADNAADRSRKGRSRKPWKFTPDVIAQIQRQRVEGRSIAEIARLLGSDRATVSRVLKRAGATS